MFKRFILCMAALLFALPAYAQTSKTNPCVWVSVTECDAVSAANLFPTYNPNLSTFTFGGVTAQYFIGMDASGTLWNFGSNPLPANISPCKPINIYQTTSTDIYTSTGTIRVCGIWLGSATAQNIGIGEGTGTLCATGFHALFGMNSTTPGFPVGVTGGIAPGSGIPMFNFLTVGDHFCLFQSGTGVVAGLVSIADN